MIREFCLVGTIALASGLSAYSAPDVEVTNRVKTGDIARGRTLVVGFGCNACHRIPGIRGPQGIVGPPLAGVAARPLLGGAVPNHPANLVNFLINAPSLVPSTGMPAMPIDRKDAEDIAAYLSTLR